jgi:hypothetical protein
MADRPKNLLLALVGANHAANIGKNLLTCQGRRGYLGSKHVAANDGYAK